MGSHKSKNRGSGGGRSKGARSKKKEYKRACWLKNRKVDTDQLQDNAEKAEITGIPADKFEYDDELPGGGQFFAIETGMHFIDAKALADHKKSRYYKRRCKDLKEEKYTQEEAERASGMTKEKLPPAHPKEESTSTTA
jgi:bud site selection protein 20